MELLTQIKQKLFNMKKYKIVYGYGEFDYVPIGANELPKAFYAFRQGSNLVTDDGNAVRGKDIRVIEYNWHKRMGFVDITHQNREQVARHKENSSYMLKQADEIARLAIERKDVSILKDYESISKSYKLAKSNKKEVLSIDNTK